MGVGVHTTGLRFGVVAILGLGLLAANATTGRATATGGEGRQAEVKLEAPQPPALSSADAAPDIDRIRKRGKLIVAMFFEDVGPFFMHTQGGEFTGIDVALARYIASQLGVEVEFNRAP